MNQGMITPTTCKTHTCTVTHIRFYIGTEIPLSSLPNKRSGFNPVQLTEKEALPIFHRPTVVSQYTALISNTDVTTFFLLLPVPRWHKPSCVITLKMLASLSLNSGGKKKIQGNSLSLSSRGQINMLCSTVSWGSPSQSVQLSRSRRRKQNICVVYTEVRKEM